MAVTPQMVKQLRDRTDQPMGLCKQALDTNAGDMDKAIDWLKAQNSKMGVKREGNETAEGRIGAFVDNAGKVAARFTKNHFFLSELCVLPLWTLCLSAFFNTKITKGRHQVHKDI